MKAMHTEILTPSATSGCVVLASASKKWGRELYSVWQTNDGARFIRVDLCGGNPKAGEYMYKPLDEGMGPGVANCPVSFFDLVPDNGVNRRIDAAWRARCRANAAKAQVQYADGDRVTVDGGTRLYTVVRKVRASYHITDGYRVTRCAGRRLTLMPLAAPAA